MELGEDGRFCGRFTPTGMWRGICQKGGKDATGRASFFCDLRARRLTPGRPGSWRFIIKNQTVTVRWRNQYQPSRTAATKTKGKTTSLMKAQPSVASILPDMNEPKAMLPKMRKSLKA